MLRFRWGGPVTGATPAAGGHDPAGRGADRHHGGDDAGDDHWSGVPERSRYLRAPATSVSSAVTVWDIDWRAWAL